MAAPPVALQFREPPPQIIVSEEPAELIVTDGNPTFSPLPGNDLLYVWLRYAWAPYAAAAKAWSDGSDLLRGLWNMLTPTHAP